MIPLITYVPSRGPVGTFEVSWLTLDASLIEARSFDCMFFVGTMPWSISPDSICPLNQTHRLYRDNTFWTYVKSFCLWIKSFKRHRNFLLRHGDFLKPRNRRSATIKWKTSGVTTSEGPGFGRHLVSGKKHLDQHMTVGRIADQRRQFGGTTRW